MYRTARTTPLSRAFLVAEADRIGVSRAARNMGVSRRTVQRWRRRAPDFTDRACRPLHSPRRLCDELEAQILALRVERRWGPDRIAAVLGLRTSTVHRVLRRHSAHRLSHLFPKPRRSFGRFEITTPGELVAMDTKSLGSLARGGGRHPGIGGGHSGAGWRQLHVAIDLASRVVVAQERPTCGNIDTLAFLEHALATYAAMGIRVQRLLTDNGAGYKRTFHERGRARTATHADQALSPLDQRPGRAFQRDHPTRVPVR